MPADERLKVIFKSVFVRDDSDVFGDGEFYFIASVGGVAVGNPKRIFKAVENTTIALPEAEWSQVVNVRGQNTLVVSFHGKEQDLISDDDLGTIRHTLRFPYSQQVFRHSTRFFILEWHVELASQGRFGRHAPADIFACRQEPGAVSCTTVSGARVAARLEFHPVIPVPKPPPATVLPARPAGLSGAPDPNPNDHNIAIAPNSPINAIHNPAVIPILGPPNAAPAGPHTPDDLDRANWVNTRNAARIEYTYYQPATLNLVNDDPRLEWTVVSLAGGGAAKFLRSDGSVSATALGPRVMVYGTAAGEVRLEARFKGALCATYRALVLQVKRVPCRCNILNGPTPDSTPRADPAEVKNHVDLANRFLRQLGIELTLDTNPHRSHGAHATAIPGIFRINVPRGRTRHLADTNWATLRNYRPNVMNFAYIFSDDAGNLGAATDFPASLAGASVSDPPAGTPGAAASPSTSWRRPTGVGVGADATTTSVVMNVIGARQRAGHPQLFAMYVSDGNGGARVPANNHKTLARQREYANTMAHEFGHILNLGHRVEGVPETAPGRGDQRDMTAADAPATLNAGGIYWDGLLHPPHENVMQWWDPASIAQDFDIIQARAVQRSPLVVAAPSMAPAVPP